MVTFYYSKTKESIKNIIKRRLAFFDVELQTLRNGATYTALKEGVYTGMKLFVKPDYNLQGTTAEYETYINNNLVLKFQL